MDSDSGNSEGDSWQDSKDSVEEEDDDDDDDDSVSKTQEKDNAQEKDQTQKGDKALVDQKLTDKQNAKSSRKAPTKLELKKELDDMRRSFATMEKSAAEWKSQSDEFKRKLEEEKRKLEEEKKANALKQLTAECKCCICFEIRHIPVKICSAHDAHIACLECALHLSSGHTVVNERESSDPSTWVITMKFKNASHDRYACPLCKAETKVVSHNFRGGISYHGVLLGEHFRYFNDQQYAEWSALAQVAKIDTWMDIKPSDYTLKDNSILEYISCRFSDRERIFKCPVGSTVSQSHATRFRACQGHVSENICWAQWIAKGALFDPWICYTNAIREHARKDCLTRVGSCSKCPIEPATTALRAFPRHFGVPACEAFTHSQSHDVISFNTAASSALLMDMIKALKESCPPASSDIADRFVALTKHLGDAHKKMMELIHVGLHTSEEKQASLALKYDELKFPWRGIYATYSIINNQVSAKLLNSNDTAAASVPINNDNAPLAEPEAAAVAPALMPINNVDTPLVAMAHWFLPINNVAGPVVAANPAVASVIAAGSVAAAGPVVAANLPVASVAAAVAAAAPVVIANPPVASVNAAAAADSPMVGS